MHPLSRLIFFVGLCLSLAAHGYTNVTLYDESRGLSNHTISQLLKDRTGLLWIATESGLNTFDGYNFKEIEDFRGMKIRSLCYDSLRHILWVGCNTGLYRLDVSTQHITDCTARIRDNKEVLRIFAYNDAIYPVFTKGIILKVSADGSAEPVFNRAQVGAGAFAVRKHMATDQVGNLYIIPDGPASLIRINLNTKEVKIVKEAPSREIWDIASAQGYIIVQWNRKGITFFNESGAMPGIDAEAQKDTRIGMIYGYKDKYYASLRGQYGVYKLDKKTLQWELLKSNDNVTFKSKTVTTIFEDAHDVLWIGTNKGLIKMSLERSYPFKTLFEGYSPAVSNRQIIKGKKNDLYIATYNGIYHYDMATSGAVLLDSSENDSVFPLYTRALLLRDRYIYAGTESHTNYFYRFNLATGHCEGGFYKTEPANAQISSVHSIFEDSQGRIWLATDKGLATYDPRNNKLTLHISGKYSVGETRLFYLTPTGQTKFWAAGRNGAYLIDINTGVERQLLAGVLPKMVADDYIFAGEKNGKLWLGTKRSGIVVLDSGFRNARVINTSNGLSANEVYALMWQDDKTVWISTVNGLCRYTVPTGLFNNYFFEEGVTDNEFNQNSFLRYSDHLFFFGGINGITYFDPDQIGLDPEQLTIFNASASKWNQGLQSFVSVNGNSNVIMHPDDHLLEFSFGLSDFSDADEHVYFYRINGLYNDWVSLGNQNILRLEGLPAGNYVVEVIGYNKRGIASANSLKYTIRIVQVFYKTWWFYVLLALGISALVFGYFRWRIHNIQQKQKLRTQIASNLHDEVGSLLTSIIISTDSARYSSHSVEEKNAKLEKISALSRDATNTMSDVLWSIDARNDYAGNLTDRMREQAEAMLLPLGIDVEFDFTATQQEQNIHPDTRQQLYLIFKEAINNIAKHSRANWVKVCYSQQGRDFELTIRNDNNRDTGEAVSYPGQGLKNMEMRAKRIHATCTCHDSGGGFSVVVKSK